MVRSEGGALPCESSTFFAVPLRPLLMSDAADLVRLLARSRADWGDRLVSSRSGLGGGAGVRVVMLVRVKGVRVLSTSRFQSVELGVRDDAGSMAWAGSERHAMMAVHRASASWSDSHRSSSGAAKAAHLSRQAFQVFLTLECQNSNGGSLESGRDARWSWAMRSCSSSVV